MGIDGRRRKARRGVALAAASAVHLVLLALIIGYRPAPPPLSGAAEVSLIPASGLSFSPAQSAPEPPTPPTPLPPAPTPTPPSPTPPTLAPVVPAPAVTEAKVSAPLKLKAVPLIDPTSELKLPAPEPSLGGAPPPPGAPPAALASAASDPATGKACAIPETLKASLQTSPQVAGALSLVPARARSVANAILLWDGRWIDAPSIGGLSALGPIQLAVLQTIATAPPACRNELVRGPRLITIGDARSTTVLAFGSGEWRWADLLNVAPPTQLP